MIMILSLHSVSGVVSNDSRVLHRILENQHKKEKGTVTVTSWIMLHVYCLPATLSLPLCLCAYAAALCHESHEVQSVSGTKLVT